ncbi:MFS transporter [Eubacterium oxidoreducens]|uniref:Major Facilitator Superfamily protein n=1 Tax=Eubacterium oxidoreducens TaxID=1732 RepID=A0A1G6BMH7_EUBOX|nr:MFS transporter [Eubacterium oxidoreducens]SDB21787.1 Major Facilitator Superfamily protein [Eubacterium oxidoreducens]
MEGQKKTAAFNLGAKGLVIVILGFVSCYLYSALTSDSLNVTVKVFGGMGLDTNFIYALSSIATILGIVGSILFGKLMSMATASKVWGIVMILTAVFAFIWSRTAGIAIGGNVAIASAVYAIGYFVCYVLALVSAMLLSYQVIGNWFPRKRGVAIGIATAGYPVSAATTTTLCGKLASNISNFYIVMAVIALIVGIIVLLFSRDFPEDKGCYPDNDHNFDFEAAKAQHLKNLEYLKTSKWTVGKCLTTGRMWIMWVTVGIGGFLSMGIMSNFYGKFTEQGYQPEQIFAMLGIAGVIAIPGSAFIGWLDVKLGTKKTTVLINVLAAVAIAFNLTQTHALHYVSLPILALMLGGSSNMMVSCTMGIWGRYDFENAFRVIQPLNAIMTGIGITVVGIVGTNFGYLNAYKLLMVMAIIAVIFALILKVEFIDDDVRRLNEQGMSNEE